MKLFILRHGSTPLMGRFCGRTDPVLTDEGRMAMEDRSDGRHWPFVFSSPLKRCADFAISLDAGAILDDGFQELDFGEWEGRETAEIWASDRELLEAFWRDPDLTPPPGGEKWGVFISRVGAAMDRLLKVVEDQAADEALLITHAGVMRALLVLYVGMPLEACWNIALPPASMLELDFMTVEEGVKHKAMLTGLAG